MFFSEKVLTRGIIGINTSTCMKYDFKKRPSDYQEQISENLRELGHLPYRPKQPNGWSDFEEDWISPELIIRRLIMASKISNYYLSRDSEVIKMIVENNFDNPNEIFDLISNIDQNDHRNKFALICNAPAMLKA